MTYDAFVDLVSNLRAAQREFFRTKSSAALEQSKRLEKQVDAAIREYREQPSLFGREV
jgi:hypothetical protein